MGAQRFDHPALTETFAHYRATVQVRQASSGARAHRGRLTKSDGQASPEGRRLGLAAEEKYNNMIVDATRYFELDVWMVEASRDDLVGDTLALYPLVGQYELLDDCAPMVLAIAWSFAPEFWEDIGPIAVAPSARSVLGARGAVHICARSCEWQSPTTRP